MADGKGVGMKSRRISGIWDRVVVVLLRPGVQGLARVANDLSMAFGRKKMQAVKVDVEVRRW